MKKRRQTTTKKNIIDVGAGLAVEMGVKGVSLDSCKELASRRRGYIKTIVNGIDRGREREKTITTAHNLHTTTTKDGKDNKGYFPLFFPAKERVGEKREKGEEIGRI